MPDEGELAQGRLTPPLTILELQALAYVRNAREGAAVQHFLEDHDPLGPRLYARLWALGLIVVDGDRRIHLTAAAVAQLEAAGG